jgi:hypothetical protein
MWIKPMDQGESLEAFQEHLGELFETNKIINAVLLNHRAFSLIVWLH